MMFQHEFTQKNTRTRTRINTYPTFKSIFVHSTIAEIVCLNRDKFTGFFVNRNININIYYYYKIITAWFGWFSEEQTHASSSFFTQLNTCPKQNIVILIKIYGHLICSILHPNFLWENIEYIIEINKKNHRYSNRATPESWWAQHYQIYITEVFFSLSKERKKRTQQQTLDADN